MSEDASMRPGAEALEPELERYAAIERFASLELELAGGGEMEALESHLANWDALIAGLPEVPPPSARLLLERASLLRERARIELQRIRDALLSDLANTGHVARAAHGYAPPSARRPQLDRTV